MQLKIRAINFSLILFLLIFVAIYYRLPLRGGLAYYSPDTSRLNYAVLRDFTNELKSGQYNLWEPSLFLGSYRAANPTLGLYSPRLIFYFIFSDYTAQTVCLFYLFLISGIGAFLLGLSITGSRSAALFMGITYSCSGFIASMHINIPYLSAAWFPWVFWSYEKYRRERGPGWLMPFFLAMIGLDGDLVGCFITLACLWAVFILAPDPLAGRKRLAGLLLLTTILVPALLGIILGPAFELMAESRRGVPIPYDDATLFSMHPLRLLNLLAPGLWGEYLNHSFWGHHISSALYGQRFWMESIYIGLIPVACIGLAIFDRQSRNSIRAPLFLALVMLLFSFGKYTPIYPLAYGLIPGLDRFRYPAKFYAWTSFFLIWCSAVGFARLSSASHVEPSGMSPWMKKIWPKGLAALFIIALSGILAYILLSQHLVNDPPENIDRYLFLLKRDALRLALAAIIIPLMLGVQRKGIIRSNLIPFGLIGLLLLDLSFAAPYFSRRPKDLLDQPSAVGTLLANLPKGRLFRPRKFENYSFKASRASLKHNWGLLEGVEYVRGYGPEIPRRFEPITKDSILSNFKPLARIMAIRYVMSSIHPGVPEIRELYNEGFLLAERFFLDDNLVLLSLSNPYPQIFITRQVSWAPSKEKALEWVSQKEFGPLVLEKQEAFFEGKPMHPAPQLKARMEGDAVFLERLNIQRPTNDEIKVQADLERPALLVIREGLTRGWRAWVNGKPRVLYRADYFGAAVELPAGYSHTRFYFSPKGYKIGALTSAFAFILILVWILISRRGVKRSV